MVSCGAHSGPPDKELTVEQDELAAGVRISRIGLLVRTQSIKKGREDVEMREDDGISMMTRTKEGVVIALFVSGSLDIVVCIHQDRFGEVRYLMPSRVVAFKHARIRARERACLFAAPC